MMIIWYFLGYMATFIGVWNFILADFENKFGDDLSDSQRQLRTERLMVTPIVCLIWPVIVIAVIISYVYTLWEKFCRNAK